MYSLIQQVGVRLSWHDRTLCRLHGQMLETRTVAMEAALEDIPLVQHTSNPIRSGSTGLPVGLEILEIGSSRCGLEQLKRDRPYMNQETRAGRHAYCGHL